MSATEPRFNEITMVTRYDVISSRWSSHFWVKVHVVQLFSTLKVKLVDRMMQSKYLCVILQVKAQKNIYFPFFFTWFLILDKPNLAAKMATLFWDVTEIQQCHHPQNKPHRVEKIKGFPWKAKFFWNTATYQKLKGGGGGQSTHPPCTTVGFCVYVWGSSSGPVDVVRLTIIKQNSMVFCKC